MPRNRSRHAFTLLTAAATVLALAGAAAGQVRQTPPGAEPEPAPNTNQPEIRPFLDPGLVPPVPFDATGPGGHAPDGGRAVYKNLVTGEVREFDPGAMPEGMLDQDFEAGTLEFGHDEYLFRNFGSLSEVADPTIHPWRVNCRLIMEWYDANGNFLGSGSCSGTLIDGRHVLTANHCTFDRDGWGWADKVYVYPAYDESDIDPFGVSQSVGILGWTGYTQNGDWNYDMSVVILDRPIGGITGWHGYGFNSNCSFFTGNTFHNASYPAEGAYGFDGKQMYYRYGNFDACTEVNLKKYNSLAYKGMSGSSAYYIDGNSRYAYAVTSHRRPDGSADCNATWCSYLTAMWGDFFYHVRDTLIPDTYGNSVDFYPMWVKTSSSTVNTGTPIGNFSYYCYNNSDASFNGTVWADLYISTNDIISTADKHLGTLGFNWNTGGRGSAFLSYDDLVEVPNDFVLEGDYYIGVIITNNDASNGNNDSSGQEAMPIFVNARPDLTPTAVDAAGGTYNPLDMLPVDVSVRNIGGDDSASYSVDIRASTNTIISTSDPLIGTIDGGSLNAFTTESFDVSRQIPGNLPPGTYYIGVIVNGDRAEYSDANNTGYDTVRITIVADDCTADFNGDGLVNTQDFISYLNAWSAKNPSADMDNNGTINTQDFIAFLNLWTAGC